jgi:cell division protein FtsL
MTGGLKMPITRKHVRTPVLLEKTEKCVPAVRTRRCLRTECILSAILIGVLAMVVTWGSSAIVKAGYELVQSRACLTKLEKQNELLRMEMARLKSPQRIQQIAEKQLGMIKPAAVYVASKEARNNKTGKDGSTETVAAKGNMIFGNARAEAHPAQ